MRSLSNQAELSALSTGSEGHRSDVEGLRALAVGLVVLFHAEVGFMAGGYVGVDVFFVISGFLITGLLVREMEQRGRVDLQRFYARRIRRLLPASVVTLVGVAIMTFAVLPQTRWSGIASDITWSSLYGVNWRFAGQAVDYLAADVAPSPVLHFWSLAVEEQFYLVWPFILLAFTLLARRHAESLRRPLVFGLLAISVPSFAWSVYLTQTSPGSAYFVTTTRMWELAVGGGLAILAPQLARMTRSLAEILAALGLLAIVVAAATYGATTLFPGYTAALPVLGTASVIAAGISHQETVGARLLSWRPLVVIGGFSYAIYLWHWPVLVGADAMWGPLSVPQALLAVLVATAIAWVSYTTVEQPLRRSAVIITPPVRGLVFGALLTMLGVGAGVWLSNSLPEIAAAPTTTTTTPRASEQTVFVPPPVVIQEAATAISPDPLVARDDIPVVYDEGCHQSQADAEPIYCEFGADDGPIVALVGDSHAAQWVPAMRRLADEYQFQLRTYTKSACPLAAVDFVIGEQNLRYDSCYEWNDLLMEELTGPTKPDVLVTSMSYKWAAMDESGDRLPTEQAQVLLADGLTITWNKITEAGVPVLVIRDTPRPSFDVPECVVSNRADLIECSFDREASLQAATAQIEAADRTEVTLVDLADRICSTDLCPAVTENLLVWRDRHHLTATYARYIAPSLGLELAPLLGL